MLRKCTAQEDGARVAAPSLAYQKDDVLAALQVSLKLAEVVLTVDGLLVDFQDHVAPPKTNVLGKGVRLHVLNDDAFPCRRAQAVGQVSGKRFDRDAQFAFGGLFLVVVVLFVAQAVAEEFGAIRDSDAGFTWLAIAQVSDL